MKSRADRVAAVATGLLFVLVVGGMEWLLTPAADSDRPRAGVTIAAR